MKVEYEKTIIVKMELNEMEAVALAQLCVQVGGAPGLRRDFYHQVWQRIRGALGEVPNASGIFTFGPDAILVTGAGQTGSKAP